MRIKFILLAPAFSQALALQERREIPFLGEQDAYTPGVFRQSSAGEGPIDISEITYSGLNTFAGVAHAQCFRPSHDEKDATRYDIAVLGAPLDTVSSGFPRKGIYTELTTASQRRSLGDRVLAMAHRLSELGAQGKPGASTFTQVHHPQSNQALNRTD